MRRRLGQGASGFVFEALDRARNEVVAIKTVRANDVSNVAILKNEFRAVQDVVHPNLVRLGELFEAGGQWFFTMELVVGTPLIEYVRPTGKTYDEARLRDVLLQLAEGLAALHAAHIVHRDVKPSNILVTADGRVVLLDFGIARDLASRRQALDDDGAIVGTVAYMAPEQAGGTATAAADWYAFGVILYEALVGELPFMGSMGAIVTAKTRDVAPDPRAAGPIPEDLASLCVDLLRTDPEARPSDGAILARLGGSGEERRFESSGRIAVFVGRSREMATLEDAFLEVAAGNAVSVMVEGESGVGKSYLVRHFLERVSAEHPGAVILEGRCYERESVPYKAVDGIMDDLRIFLENMSASDREQLLPQGARGLVQLFPILGEAFSSTSRVTHEEIVNPTELRLRAFAVLRDLLRRLALSAPLIVSIDDFQWADADGLALLAEVMRPPDAPPLLLVATVRTSTSVGGLATDATLPGKVRFVRVQKLPSADAEELVNRLLGDRGRVRVPDAEISAIVEDAGGHPLFLDELVRRRSVQGERADRVRLDDAIWLRVEALDPDARRLVELASVAGLPIAPRVAGAAATLSTAQLFRALLIARAGRLVRTSGSDDASAIDVYHDRIRASVLARLDPSARAEWHGRIAVALEAQAGADAELMATHWLGAGQKARAATYTVTAAKRAVATLAFDHAARLFQQALDLGVPEADRRELRQNLAEALTNAGRAADAAEVRLSLAADAPPLEALDLRRQAAEQFLCSGHFDRGNELLGEVLASLRISDPQASPAILGLLMLHRTRLRLRGMRFRARDAADIPPRELLRVDALRSAGAGFSMSDLMRGACFQAQATLAALDLGEPQRVHHALAFECIFLASAIAKNRDRVMHLLELLEASRERVGTAEAFALTSAAHGYVCFNDGRFPEARDKLTEAEELFRDQCVGVTFELGSLRVVVYRTLIYMGAVKELARRVPSIQRELEQRRDLYSLTNLRATALPYLALAADEPERSRALLADAEASLTRKRILLQHVFVLASRVQTELYAGDVAAARATIETAWRPLERSLLLKLQTFRTFAFGFRARCAIAAAAQSPGSRDALLREGEASCERLAKIATPWSDADAHMVRALALRMRGRTEEAIASMREARARFAAQQLRGFEAAATWRLGEWIGGDEGAALLRTAEASLRDEGVKEPARMVRALAP